MLEGIVKPTLPKEMSSRSGNADCIVAHTQVKGKRR